MVRQGHVVRASVVEGATTVEIAWGSSAIKAMNKLGENSRGNSRVKFARGKRIANMRATVQGGNSDEQWKH